MLSNKEIYASMKRIEIVIYEESLEELLELFAEANIKGYTVIKKIGGYGSTGERDQDDFILEQYNASVLLVCEEEKAVNLLAILQPRLKDLGGICLVNDCQRILGSFEDE